MYNIVQVVSSIEATVRGKSVIWHNAAKKDALAVAHESGGQGGYMLMDDSPRKSGSV